MNPKTSIILPTYNGATYLDEAIESVLNQTFKDFELIIIDDHSTDNTPAILSKYHDPKIRVITHAVNKGLIETLNEGIAESKGEYIARIDADDIWTDSAKLEKQVAFLDQHQEYSLVGTQAIMIDENGKKLFPSHYPSSDKEIRNSILSQNYFIHPSVVFRKRVAQDAGGFLAGELYVEDYSLWLRMGEKSKFINIDEPMMSYRIHTEGESLKNNLAQITNSLSLIKKYKQSYPHYSKAWIKWTSKKILLAILSPKMFLILKRIRSSLHL